MSARQATPLTAIFGAGRNGSSLLMRVLDGSPDLWILPVDVVFLLLWDDLAAGLPKIRGESYRTASTRSLRFLDVPIERRIAWDTYGALIDDLDEHYVSKLVEPADLRRERFAPLAADGTVTLREFVPEFLEAARDAIARDGAPPARSLGFKTAETRYVDDYLRIWPDLRCIHIVREPLSNYASVKRTWLERKQRPFWIGTGGEDHLRTFLESRWLPHARAVLRHRGSAPNQHLVVRYEDLVDDPRREVLKLCDQLGIAPPPEPDRLTVLGGEALRSWPDNPSQPGVATPDTVLSDIPQRFGYDEILTQRERDLIELTTGALAERLGYPPPARRVGRASLWLRWLPVDSSERRYSTKRLALEIAKRRLFLTRLIFAGSR